MKTILVPTDFSEEAKNAANYAAAFAKKWGAGLILFHTYHIPIHVAISNGIESYDNIGRKEHLRLKKIADNFQKLKGNDIDIEYISKSGFLVEEITALIKEQNIDLVIMGTSGRKNQQEKHTESNIIEIINRASCPVLTIPGKAHFNEVSKIVFATDFEEIHDKSVMNTLILFATTFHSEILVFNVMTKKEIPVFNKAVEGVVLENCLEAVKHTYHFSSHNNIAEAIENFLEESRADMLAVVGRKHNFFENIFHKSITEQMILNTSIPLLTLPESISK